MRNIYLHGPGVRLFSRTSSEAVVPLGHSLLSVALPEIGQAIRCRERGAGFNTEATGGILGSVRALPVKPRRLPGVKATIYLQRRTCSA